MHIRLLLLLLSIAACDRSASPQATAARDAATGDVVAIRYPDADARRAAELLATGHPWRATRTLAPLLADSARRTPDIVLLAATAASGWGGWRLADSLLTALPALDSLADGAGWELRARAALARDDAEGARAHAGRAIALAAAERARGERTVLLARALDRLDRRDSARVAYEGAARLLPELRDWLLLRAAGVSDAPEARAAFYARVEGSAARDRVRWTEAYARERTGDVAGAARAFDSLGAGGSALRNRAALASRDSTLRPALRRELLAVVERRAGTPDARTAVELLDARPPALTAAQELLVARSAAASGPLGRAATAYARALAGGAGTLRDRYGYGLVLYRLNRDRDAAAQLERVSATRAKAPPALAAAAGYARGRALVAAGDPEAARAALRDVVARFPRDSSAGAALMLLADLATDEGRDGAARDAYRQAVAVLPRGSERAALARFRGAVIDLAASAPRQAAAALDSLVALDPSGAETNAAIYWSGRAWAASGDSARARERWRAMTARDPLSYYASASARRLGDAAWRPPSASDDGAPGGAIAEAIERAARLEAVGMDAERRLELDALAREAAASASAERMLATAAAFRAAGEPSRGINMALRALDAGAPRDARLYRLLYPLDHHEALAEDARANGLDAALVAALVRQESRWTARATSAAGARGLMQVLPSVGGSLARVAGVAPWDPVLLYEPEVNLLLGTRHLRNYFARYAGGAAATGDSLTMHARALAAYNAGQSRVTRWAGKNGVADPELFIERIPFAETRDYVRIVLRNAELYRALYEW